MKEYADTQLSGDPSYIHKRYLTIHPNHCCRRSPFAHIPTPPKAEDILSGTSATSVPVPAPASKLAASVGDRHRAAAAAALSGQAPLSAAPSASSPAPLPQARPEADFAYEEKRKVGRRRFCFSVFCFCLLMQFVFLRCAFEGRNRRCCVSCPRRRDEHPVGWRDGFLLVHQGVVGC